jgi:hypothetical protein
MEWCNAKNIKNMIFKFLIVEMILPTKLSVTVAEIQLISAVA